MLVLPLLGVFVLLVKPSSLLKLLWIDGCRSEGDGAFWAFLRFHYDSIYGLKFEILGKSCSSLVESRLAALQGTFCKCDIFLSHGRDSRPLKVANRCIGRLLRVLLYQWLRPKIVLIRDPVVWRRIDETVLIAGHGWRGVNCILVLSIYRNRLVALAQKVIIRAMSLVKLGSNRDGGKTSWPHLSSSCNVKW